RDRPLGNNLNEWADLRTEDGHLLWAAAALHAGTDGLAGFPDLVVNAPTTGPTCYDPAPPCGTRSRFTPTVAIALGPQPAAVGMGVSLNGPRDSGNMVVTEYMTQTTGDGCAEPGPAIGWVFFGQANGDGDANPPCGGSTQCIAGEYCDDLGDTCS